VYFEEIADGDPKCESSAPPSGKLLFTLEHYKSALLKIARHNSAFFWWYKTLRPALIPLTQSPTYPQPA
jgi:hypothetical protein